MTSFKAVIKVGGGTRVERFASNPECFDELLELLKDAYSDLFSCRIAPTTSTSENEEEKEIIISSSEEDGEDHEENFTFLPISSSSSLSSSSSSRSASSSSFISPLSHFSDPTTRFLEESFIHVNVSSGGKTDEKGREEEGGTPPISSRHSSLSSSIFSSSSFSSSGGGGGGGGGAGLRGLLRGGVIILGKDGPDTRRISSDSELRDFFATAQHSPVPTLYITLEQEETKTKKTTFPGDSSSLSASFNAKQRITSFCTASSSSGCSTNSFRDESDVSSGAMISSFCSILPVGVGEIATCSLLDSTGTINSISSSSSNRGNSRSRSSEDIDRRYDHGVSADDTSSSMADSSSATSFYCKSSLPLPSQDLWRTANNSESHVENSFSGCRGCVAFVSELHSLRQENSRLRAEISVKSSSLVEEEAERTVTSKTCPSSSGSASLTVRHSPLPEKSVESTEISTALPVDIPSSSPVEAESDYPSVAGGWVGRTFQTFTSFLSGLLSVTENEGNSTSAANYGNYRCSHDEVEFLEEGSSIGGLVNNMEMGFNMGGVMTMNGKEREEGEAAEEPLVEKGEREATKTDRKKKRGGLIVDLSQLSSTCRHRSFSSPAGRGLPELACSTVSSHSDADSNTPVNSLPSPAGLDDDAHCSDKELDLRCSNVFARLVKNMEDDGDYESQDVLWYSDSEIETSPVHGKTRKDVYGLHAHAHTITESGVRMTPFVRLPSPCTFSRPAVGLLGRLYPTRGDRETEQRMDVLEYMSKSAARMRWWFLSDFLQHKSHYHKTSNFVFGKAAPAKYPQPFSPPLYLQRRLPGYSSDACYDVTDRLGRFQTFQGSNPSPSQYKLFSRQCGISPFYFPRMKLGRLLDGCCISSLPSMHQSPSTSSVSSIGSKSNSQDAADSDALFQASPFSPPMTCTHQTPPLLHQSQGSSSSPSSDREDSTDVSPVDHHTSRRSSPYSEAFAEDAAATIVAHQFVKDMDCGSSTDMFARRRSRWCNRFRKSFQENSSLDSLSCGSTTCPSTPPSPKVEGLSKYNCSSRKSSISSSTDFHEDHHPLVIRGTSTNNNDPSETTTTSTTTTTTARFSRVQKIFFPPTLRRYSPSRCSHTHQHMHHHQRHRSFNGSGSHIIHPSNRRQCIDRGAVAGMSTLPSLMSLYTNANNTFVGGLSSVEHQSLSDIRGGFYSGGFSLKNVALRGLSSMGEVDMNSLNAGFKYASSLSSTTSFDVPETNVVGSSSSTSSPSVKPTSASNTSHCVISTCPSSSTPPSFQGISSGVSVWRTILLKETSDSQNMTVASSADHQEQLSSEVSINSDVRTARHRLWSPCARGASKGSQKTVQCQPSPDCSPQPPSMKQSLIGWDGDGLSSEASNLNVFVSTNKQQPFRTATPFEKVIKGRKRGRTRALRRIQRNNETSNLERPVSY